MMVSDVEILKSTAVFNLMYNYTIRVDFKRVLEIEEKPRRSLRENEALELGKTYIERSGFPVVMIKQVGEDRGEYHLGYHFLGDNGVWYKSNGSTGYKDDLSMNDVIAFILD